MSSALGDGGGAAPAGEAAALGLATSSPAGPPRAVVLRGTAGLAEAARRLRAGGVVAFPTETVYGLGANALDARAVAAVFRFKGRPATDPLIVHFADAAAAAGALALDWPPAAAAFAALAAAAWPGPLTLVGRAAPHVPAAVAAGTGFVGVRVPAHARALELLAAAGVPVAAPSANRFGHVSPTAAAHVLADLGHCDIAVLAGEDGDEGEGEGEGGEGGRAGEGIGAGGGSGERACAVGIESTVVKLVEPPAGADGTRPAGGLRLAVLRRGGMSVEELRRALARAAAEGAFGAGGAPPPVDVPGDDAGGAAAGGDAGAAAANAGAAATNAAAIDAATAAGAPVGDEAPGQAVTHYAPDVPAVLVTSPAAFPARARALPAGAGVPRAALARAVVVDFGGALAPLAPLALAYRDLSARGDVFEARARAFDVLRWAERVHGARLVVLADPLLRPPAATEAAPAPPGGGGEGGGARPERGHAEALRDRLFRAASGELRHVDAVLADAAAGDEGGGER